MADATTGGVLAHRALYAAFDRYPSSKGAAVHIGEWADELFSTFGGGLLHVLGGGELPPYQREPVSGSRGPVEIVRFGDQIPNLLDRIEAYRTHLGAVVARHRDTLEVVHVRDPWSASVILADPHRRHRLVYEVNGLPSVELPYRYRDLGAATLDKFRTLERRCLEGADRVLVPSAVLAARVRTAGADPATVQVIRNGARLVDPRPPRPEGSPARYLVYVGALQSWQGIETMLRAFARLTDLDDLRLVICASTPPRSARAYRRLASERTYVLEPLHDDHHRFLVEQSAEVVPLELVDPPPDASTGALGAWPEEAGAGDRARWLIAHTGPASEVAELVAYARDQAEAESVDPVFVVATPVGAAPEPAPDLVRLDQYPVWPLFDTADRIVTAAGFNAMRQLAGHRDRHRFLAMPRRYDDQPERARRAHRALVP